jgi:hypothetical protein
MLPGRHLPSSSCPVYPWFAERPSIRVGRLVCRNAVRRWPLLGVSVALALVASAALGHFPSVGHALVSAAAAPVVVAGISAVLFGTATLRRRKRLASHRYRDWLAALPNDLPLAARAAGVPTVVWSGVVLATMAAAAGAKLSASASGALLAASAAGCLSAAAAVAICVSGGASLSLRLRRAPDRSRYTTPASRYAIIRRPRRAWATNPRLLPLGYWPLAQTKFWDRPKVRARSLALLLVALPLDVTGAVAVAAAAVWLITLHLVNLLLGAMRVAFAASRWLAPTPVGLVRFTVAVSHRALVAEVASCALLIGMIYAIGGAATVQRSIAPAIGWIGTACALSVAACVLALRTRSVARSVLHRWMQ